MTLTTYPKPVKPQTRAMFQKPRPKLLDKREARAEVAAEDRAENAVVKRRSQGQCEVVILWMSQTSTVCHMTPCHRRAGHIHHLRSGIGIRNRGNSIKARAKLHVCELHHEEIHGHVLKPIDEAKRYDAATVRYERIT